MKLYKEYGSSSPDGPYSSNWTPVSNLTYTQALLLLGLPEEEREEFIAENDVAGMTKQELQQALQENEGEAPAITADNQQQIMREI